MHRIFLPLLVAVLLLTANGSWAYQQNEFYRVEEIRPNMVGTIYCGLGEGGTIEAYTVIVKSVLGNRGRQGDGWRAVLIEAGDDLLEAYGGFVSGMSGAPVYIEGRLAGAFYEHFEWTLQNFGLMRPIEQMLKLWEGEKGQPPPVGSVPFPENERVYVDGKEFAALQLVSGDEAEDFIASLIDNGIMPMVPASAQVVNFPGSSGEQQGVVDDFRIAIEDLPAFTPWDVFVDETREPIHDFGPPEFRPGSLICTIKTIGDVNMWDVGCITYINPQTGRFIAFGHNVFGGLGDVNIPLADCYVYHTFESIEMTFTLAVPTRIVGTVATDAWQGIQGTLGHIPNMIRVELSMSDLDYAKDNVSIFYAADDPRIYTDAVPTGIKRAIERGLDTAGRGFVLVDYRLGTMAGDVFTFDQAYLADDYAGAAGSDIKLMLAAIAKNDFARSIPTSITADIILSKAEKMIIIRDPEHVVEGEYKDGFPEEITPGDEIEIIIRLEPKMAGGFDRSFIFKVPPDFPGGSAKIQIYGGLKRLPSDSEVPHNTFEEMKTARDGLEDPLEPVVPANLAELMGSFQPDFRADELVIQIVSTEDDDPEGDRIHFEIVEHLDGIVVGVMMQEIEIKGGDE